MKAESRNFLQKSHEFLRKAEGMLQSWPDEAGRAAYLAAFHAAQALIFERTGRAVKTHRGVHSEFARLMRHRADFDTVLRGFLSRSYNMKAVADYETGEAAAVDGDEAAAAAQTASRFVSFVEKMLSEA
ncbi:MAG TPA: HEPN domain-containing protein [Acetobacteraceae bacterium]|nr:HEPN domain-containing protein [Acetobacteraceae bacterium]